MSVFDKGTTQPIDQSMIDLSSYYGLAWPGAPEAFTPKFEWNTNVISGDALKFTNDGIIVSLKSILDNFVINPGNPNSIDISNSSLVVTIQEELTKITDKLSEYNDQVNDLLSRYVDPNPHITDAELKQIQVINTELSVNKNPDELKKLFDGIESNNVKRYFALKILSLDINNVLPYFQEIIEALDTITSINSQPIGEDSLNDSVSKLLELYESIKSWPSSMEKHREYLLQLILDFINTVLINRIRNDLINNSSIESNILLERQIHIRNLLLIVLGFFYSIDRDNNNLEAFTLEFFRVRRNGISEIRSKYRSEIIPVYPTPEQTIIGRAPTSSLDHYVDAILIMLNTTNRTIFDINQILRNEKGDTVYMDPIPNDVHIVIKGNQYVPLYTVIGQDIESPKKNKVGSGTNKELEIGMIDIEPKDEQQRTGISVIKDMPSIANPTVPGLEMKIKRDSVGCTFFLDIDNVLVDKVQIYNERYSLKDTINSSNGMQPDGRTINRYIFFTEDQDSNKIIKITPKSPDKDPIYISIDTTSSKANELTVDINYLDNYSTSLHEYYKRGSKKAKKESGRDSVPQVLLEALNLLLQDYVDTNKIDINKITYEQLEELLKNIEEHFSNLIGIEDLTLLFKDLDINKDFLTDLFLTKDLNIEEPSQAQESLSIKQDSKGRQKLDKERSKEDDEQGKSELELNKEKETISQFAKDVLGINDFLRFRLIIIVALADLNSENDDNKRERLKHFTRLIYTKGTQSVFRVGKRKIPLSTTPLFKQGAEFIINKTFQRGSIYQAIIEVLMNHPWPILTNETGDGEMDLLKAKKKEDNEPPLGLDELLKRDNK